MKDLDNIPEFSRYFRVVSSPEININREDIFYRDKYNDILNYIKIILTNHNDMAFRDYISPKGAILIKINPGTDILEYLKLLAINYYIDILEFKENEILKSPEDFIDQFIPILKSFEDVFNKKTISKSNKNNENIINDTQIESQSKKRLLIINQHKTLKEKFEEKNLLELIANEKQNGYLNFDFLDLDIILVWINYDLQDISSISNSLYKIFDLFIKIPVLNKIERETVLRDFLEKNPKFVFDINTIVSYTENWEVNDIKQLLKVAIFRHFLNSELNEISNEITDILIDLIVSGEYIPSIEFMTSEKKVNNESIEEPLNKSKVVSAYPIHEREENKGVQEVVNEIQESRISDFMLNQLYENAASKNYNELIVIIDKLAKNEALEDNDRKLLAKYPFVLNDAPNIAQINLEKGKKRIDLMKQVFGK